MEWNKVTFLIPYLVALVITTSVFVFAWRHRHIRGGIAYTWYVAGQTLWAIGYVFELLVPGLKGKIFWDSVQWIASFLIVIAFPVFAVQYTSFKIKKPRLIWGLITIVPVVMSTIVITDNWHHLIYPDPYLTFNTIYPELNYKFTWVVYGYAIYSYLVTFIGLGLLVRRLFRPHRLYARQIMTVTLGFFIPVFFTILTTAGVDFMPFRDVSILTFALGNLIIATGLFRYRLFEVVPIARELVVESMEVLVVVLDMQDRIVDINPTATQTLEMKSSQLIGQPAATIFATWPELVKRFFKPENVKSEISIGSNHFEIKSTLLYDKKERYVGRVFVARDITERKELQKALEELNQELEERVSKRTEELHKSVEQYRESEERFSTLAEAAFEGIGFSGKGRIIDCNEQLATMLGYEQSQMVGLEVRKFVAPESLEIVSEYIKSGNEGPYEHMALRQDGSTFPVEVRARTIPYKGQQVRVTIIRDITERKRTEDEIRKLSHAVEQSNASIVITDTDGKIEYVNPYFSELTGYTFKEVVGQNPSILKSGITKEAVYTDLWNTITDGKEWQGEFCNKKKTGELYWESVSVSPIIDSTGNITHYVAVKTDISERKQTEETILKQLAFEELMTVILTRFATSPHNEIDVRIQDALQKIAAFMEVERTYMIIIDPEHRDSWSITHEWNLPQAPPFLLIRRQVPMGTFPWAENQILTGNVTRINKLDDYPPEASAIFEQHSAEGTKSVLNVPVRDSDNQISGCIGVHTYSYTKTWSVEDISHLRIVGDAIANLLERKRAEEMLLNAYDTTLEGWAKALELRDKETEDHSRRVTELTVILAQAMGIEGDELIHIRRGAILHDIGKMAIPDEILRKRGPLTASERKVVEQHPIRGYELLSPISFLERALEIPYCHHEHWDGSGYPRGLKGEEIPPAARIFTVVDVWDALLSDRPYSKAWPREKAIQYLKDESGKIFDPKCVSVFLELVEKGKI